MSEDGLSQPARTLAFLVVAIATTMAVLDSSVINIALPSIARDLRLPADDVIVLVTVYQLTVVTTLLPFAALGDRFGHQHVYLSGVVVFTAASLFCAILPDLWQVTVARAVQGLGASGIMSVNIALVRFIYPRRMLGRGVANVALVVAVSAAAGPSTAALVLSIARWPWLFLVNVPLGIAALLVGWHALPRTPRRTAPFDVAGALFNVAALTLLVFGVSLLKSPVTYASAAACLAGAAAVGAGFYAHQRRVAAPILPVDLLRQPSFASTVVTAIVTFFAQSFAFIALPFLLEGSLARSTSRTGFLVSAWPVSLALVSRWAGRLSDRFIPADVSAAGLLCLMIGFLLIAAIGPAPSDAALAWRIALCGLGFGLFQPSNNRMMLEGAPPERSGSASGMQSTARLLGQSVGAAAMSVVLGSFGTTHLRAALVLPAAATAIGLIATLSIRKQRHRTISS